MLYEARRRATRNNLPFNIELSDIVIPLKCPALGIPLFVGAGFPTENSPSLDRMIPKLGYVKGNVVVVSHKANTMKNSGTLREMLMLVRFYSSVLTSEKEEVEMESKN